ncbi:subtilisin inhibitor [Gilbertella persicaria]|uniref:subtilisin inhibitor n=1 Tax=Gilbertella persicaria TaxID=101096 RepID=UPI00221EB26F|nr:subtilisin inhibitor [Gilbertella persicaria]KAI8053110.1 subtilisin inhibitor [Gilbertella persicaria]
MVSLTTLYSLAAACLIPFVMAQDKPTIPSTIIAINVGEKDTSQLFRLECNPTGGDHPIPEAACTFLDSIEGNFDQAKSSGGVCTFEYDPVTVTLFGLYEGKAVYFDNAYPNDCEARNVLGDLYPIVEEGEQQQQQ